MPQPLSSTTLLEHTPLIADARICIDGRHVLMSDDALMDVAINLLTNNKHLSLVRGNNHKADRSLLQPLPGRFDVHTTELYRNVAAQYKETNL